MKKILVVVDCQNDFITGSLRNEDAIKKVPNIVKKIREFNGDMIVVTYDTHDGDYLKTKEGEKLPVTHCVYLSDGWQPEPNISAAIKDAVLRNIKVVCINKPTFGTMKVPYEIANTLLMPSDGDCEIEFVGFCTDICVVSNVLMTKAYLYDRANITVDSNCCAGTSLAAHEAALMVMESCQINVV